MTRRVAVVCVVVVCVLTVVSVVSVPVSGRVNEFVVVSSAVWVQTLPFLLLGTAVGAYVRTRTPQSVFMHIFGSRGLTQIPRATLTGIALPACECASAHTASALTTRGLTPGAAVAFMVASPALNPIVFIATLTAFPTHPEFAFIRIGASFVCSLLIGLLWHVTGWELSPRGRHEHDEDASWVDVWSRDMVSTASILTIGAITTGGLKTWVLPVVDMSGVHEVPVMAGLAVVMSLCSEADAFVGASLIPGAPGLATLAFLVTGPVLDIKIASVQAHVFGWKFLARFVPVAAVSVAVTLCVFGLFMP